MASAVLRLNVDGEDLLIPLSQGSNVIGKTGGSADVKLNAASLSRRHALITIGESAADCTVEDLGSTNGSSVMPPGEDMEQMEAGHVYPLPHGSALVFGDVRGAFSFSGANVEVEQIKSRPHTRASATTAQSSQRRSSHTMRHGTRSTAANARAMAEQGRAAGIRHEDAYKHAKELGMQMPYDADLLWIAVASLVMPLPAGWKGLGGGHYGNSEVGVKTHRRPQSEIMGNLYRETRRKLELEDALGATLEEARLGRLLLIDPVTAVPLFHYVLPGRNTVGKARGQVDICLASKACSKQHACLEVREGVCLLSDLGSTNGTAVGELPGTASIRLAAGEEMEVVDGQLLLFGDVECTLELPGEGGPLVAVEAPEDAARSPRHSPAGSPGGGARAVQLQLHGSHAREGDAGPLAAAASPAGTRGRGGVSFEDSLAAHAAAAGGAAGGASGAAVDYGELRKIIREEVSAAVAGTGGAGGAGIVGVGFRGAESPGSRSAAVSRGMSRGTVRSRVTTAGTGVTAGTGDMGGGAGAESRGTTAPPSRGSDLVVPAQDGYSVEEEARLAEELARVELEVAGAVADAQQLLDPAAAAAAGNTALRASEVPSRKQGFLARHEARRQAVLALAQKHYRQQAPYSELGAVLLPCGALHHILSFLQPVPHLCIAAAACRTLRRACYATQETVTANGDVCRPLWSTVSLKGARCGDGHTLLSGLGAERLAGVVRLDLSGVSTVTDDTLAVIAEQCAALEHLALDRRVDVGPQVSDTGLIDIAERCPNLRGLSLPWCSRVTDAGLTAVAEHCPLLDALDVSFCHKLTDATLLAVLDRCGEGLASLRLEACDRITEQAVVAIAQLAPGLRTLSLAGCSGGATTLSVLQLARGCPNLVSIDLTGIAGLQDAAVWQLSRGCRWLRDLSLAWCVQVSDQSVAQVALNCPLLAQLSLRGCPKVTDAAVVQLAHNCCYLTQLDLRGCPQVSQTGLDAMAMMVPACHVMVLDKAAAAA